MRLALADIQLALSHHYPPALQHKLYERMAKCWIHLGDKEQARQALLAGKKLLEQQKKLLDDKKRLAALKVSNYVFLLFQNNLKTQS